MDVRQRERANELYRAAMACGMDFGDVFDDVANSIEVAVKAVPSISPKDPSNSIQRYWSTFLETYSVKCQRRWIVRCRKSKDYEAMEKLWLTSFEPVWIAGCDLAKQNQLQSLSEGYNSITSRVSNDDEESFRKWTDDLLAGLDEMIPKTISEYKRLVRKAISQSLRDLKEYDGASFLGKLKLWMSSKNNLNRIL